MKKSNEEAMGSVERIILIIAAVVGIPAAIVGIIAGIVTVIAYMQGPTATLVPPTPIPLPTATLILPTATMVPPTAMPIPPAATLVPPAATSIPPTAISTPTTIPTTILAPTNTQAAGIKLPYTNNFDEGSPQVWLVIGNDAKPIGGAYEVNGNPIVVTLLPGSDAWQDYSLTAKVKIVSGKGDFGIVARASEDCRFYLLQYVETYVRIVRFDGGECSSEHHIRVVTAFVPYEIHPGTWYTFRVDVQGTKITGYVDGVQVISTEDASYSRGKVGFRANTTQMLFDDMKVVSLNP